MIFWNGQSDGIQVHGHDTPSVLIYLVQAHYERLGNKKKNVLAHHGIYAMTMMRYHRMIIKFLEITFTK